MQCDIGRDEVTIRRQCHSFSHVWSEVRGRNRSIIRTFFPWKCSEGGQNSKAALASSSYKSRSYVHLSSRAWTFQHLLKLAAFLKGWIHTVYWTADSVLRGRTCYTACICLHLVPLNHIMLVWRLIRQRFSLSRFQFQQLTLNKCDWTVKQSGQGYPRHFQGSQDSSLTVMARLQERKLANLVPQLLAILRQVLEHGWHSLLFSHKLTKQAESSMPHRLARPKGFVRLANI